MHCRADSQSEIFQIIHDFRTGPILRPDEFAADPALAIDDVCFRWASCAEGEIALLRFVMNGEQVDAIVDEILPVCASVVVEVDAQNHDLGHALLEIDERWELFKTRGAPGSPEIQDHRLTAIIGETDCS